MFCVRKIIAFCLILLSISLCSCHKISSSYLGISKVEITANICYELPYLELYVFSTKDYSSLKIKPNKYIQSISSHTREVMLKMNNQEVDGLIHIFNVSFTLEDFVLQNLTFINQTEEFLVDIGMYQSLSLESSTESVNVTIDVLDGKGKINIYNNLYQPLYLKEEKAVTIRKHHQLTFANHTNRFVVYSNNLNSYDAFDLVLNKDYHQIGGLLQLKFQTNLEDYTIYTPYYYSNLDLVKILKEGIDITILSKITQ